MDERFDNLLKQRFETREVFEPTDVRGSASGYTVVPPPPPVVPTDAEPQTETNEPGILDEFGEYIGNVGATIGDLPDMAIRGILSAGGEAAYSAGIIDKDQADVWRKMLKSSGKMAEKEGVNPVARGLGEGLAQFGAGMIGPFKALRAVGVARPLAALVAEGLSGAFAFNPDDPNFGNFINSFEPENPIVKNIADYIQTDPNDTEAENRFRNLVQDVVPSAVVESIVKGVKTVREMDPNTIIEAGEAAEKRLSDAMSGTTLNANPIGAVGDAAIAGAGKVAQKIAPDAPPFFSAVAKTVDALPQEKGSGAQMRAMITKGEGVKPDEMAWIGLDDFLKGKKSVTKQEIKDYVEVNQVRIEEVVKSDDASIFKFAKNSTADEIGLVVSNDEGLYQSVDVIDPLIEKLRNASSAEYDDVAIELADALVDSGLDPATAKRMVFDDFEFNVQHGIRNQKGETKFSGYTLQGGENYRELLLTLPSRKRGVRPATQLEKERGFSVNEAGDVEHIGNTDTVKNINDDFRGSHFDEPNVLAHVRLNDRVGPNGQKILLVEEIQSDWHQMGRDYGYTRTVTEDDIMVDTMSAADYKALPNDDPRKMIFVDDVAPDTPLYIIGNKTTGEWENVGTNKNEIKQITIDHIKEDLPPNTVPDAPMKKSWHEMSFRRIARMAAEEGYDSVAWTPGQMQADRYRLSKHLDTIRIEKLRDGKEAGQYYVTGKKNKYQHVAEVVTEENLREMIGKELANKAIKDAPQYPDGRDYTGLDLQVGGEGMKGFYDKMVRKYAEKWGKKFGAKVETTNIETGIKTDVSGIDIIENNGKWTVIDRPNGGAQLADFSNKSDAEAYIVSLEIVAQGEAKPKVWSMKITQKMRDSLMKKGVPLFGATAIAGRGMMEDKNDN